MYHVISKRNKKNRRVAKRGVTVMRGRGGVAVRGSQQ